MFERSGSRFGARAAWALAGVLAAVAVVAPPRAEAQVSAGVHLVRANDVFAGADGVGARLAVGLPLVPAEVAVSGDWFFPDCEGDCGYRAASVDVHVPLLPLPVISPYALGGLTWRRLDLGDGVAPFENRGLGLGLGVRLGSNAIGLYLETRYEFLEAEDQWVNRIGLIF